MNKKVKVVVGVLIVLLVLLILYGVIFSVNGNSEDIVDDGVKAVDKKPNDREDDSEKVDSSLNEYEQDKDENSNKEDLDSNDEENTSDNKDNSVGNENDNSTNAGDKVNSSTENKNNQSNQSSQNNQNNQNTQNNQSNQGNQGSQNTSNKNESSTGEDKKEEEKPVSPVVDENDVYRKKLESTYGITIKYGNEMGDYKPKNLSPTRLLDSNKIKTNLTYMETELKKYPTGFFKDFKDMPVTFYLVESIPNNTFSGFTDYQFMNDIKITLVADNYFFSYTMNHEIMHYIDAYLDIKMYPNDPYQEYSKLNPLDFSYGNVQSKYNYGYNSQVKGAYFMGDYAQSSVREDRAEVFKQMMTRTYKPYGMFDEGEVLRNKALIIGNQIKTYFPSAKGTQYWDKIIG